jgi:3-hydroxy-5-methyl-1-naphthoate 3-O-methyltransferase
MEPYRYHIYVCDQKKPDGAPCCSARGSFRVIDALRKAVAGSGLSGAVQITVSGSIGLCERGPNMVIYPEGIWYSGVTPEDISEIVREHLQNGRVVERLANHDAAALHSEIETNKGKMLAALKARDQAGILPDELMQAFRAFQESRILLTAVELDIFSAVGNGATAPEIAGKINVNPRAAETLLNALVSLAMLEKKNGTFFNTPIAGRFLVQGSPDDARISLMHLVNLWERWSTMTQCVRKGTSVSYREHAERPTASTEAFIAAMHTNASLRAPQVVKAVGAADVKKMLDVGGGSGAYSIAFATANKNLIAVLFDLPTVTPIARGHIEKAQLNDRITTRDGDMRKDDFGGGFDLAFISAICHMFSPEENLQLLKRVHKALIPGGKIVIQDFILDPDKTSPRNAAVFALNMLVGTPGGGTYSEIEYSDWLKKVGFVEIRRIPLPGPTGLIIAARL